MSFIDRIETWNTGGNVMVVMVDIVHLKDGRLLGITGDSVVLYQSEKEFWEYNDRKPLPTINLED